MIKQFCYVNSVYSLFVYLLLEKEHINNTFYFFEEDISQNFQKYFKNYVFLYKIRRKNCNLFIYYFKLYKKYRRIEKILNRNNFLNKNIFLQDHLENSSYFLERMENCFLLEDGLANYDINKLNKENQLLERIKINKIFKEKIIKKINKKYKSFGLSNKVKKIYLTGIAEIPEIIKDKVEIINLKEKWEQLSLEEQEEILKIFNLKNSDLIKWQKLKNKVLLITQPLSEDGIITEKEKIEIYKEVIEKNKLENIMIKPHPREKTNYKKFFPDVELIEGKFPLEILMLLGINFKEVITIFSTAALNFKGITNINFIGTEDNIHLKEKIGEIKKVYYKI